MITTIHTIRHVREAVCVPALSNVWNRSGEKTD